jgi:lipoprotein-releasing system permease protein
MSIFSYPERMLAWRYLMPRRRDRFISMTAWFALIGIMLGVATLIIVMAVMNGFRAELLGRVLGVNGHLMVQSAGAPFLDNGDSLVDQIQAMDPTLGVHLMADGQAMILSGGQASGGLVRGMRLEDLSSRSLIADNIKSGVLAELDAPATVLIGQRMAEKYALKVGDSLRLIAPKGEVTPFGTVPRIANFRIVGIFEVGMYEYDSSFLYMSLANAQQFFRLGERATGVEIVLPDPGQLNRIKRQLIETLPPDYRIVDWQEANRGFFSAIQVERNVMFLILTMIILVAAFNIISTVVMLVKDKRRDIAILRSMGATQGAILRIFFLNGALLGVSGTILGVGLGVLFASNIESIRQALSSLTGTNLFSAEIYFLSQLPAKIEWGEVWSVVGMALALSFIAAIFPALRAARMDPVEALRND